MSDFNTNQFSMSAKPGQVDLSVTSSENLFTCRYNPAATSTNRLVDGEGVLLKDIGADDSKGPPIVDELAADTDTPFGIKVFTTKENNNVPGDIVQVATPGAVVFMKASGAVERGDVLSLIAATPGSVKVQTNGASIGVALDKAADTELVRVLVKFAAEILAEPRTLVFKVTADASTALPIPGLVEGDEIIAAHVICTADNANGTLVLEDGAGDDITDGITCAVDKAVTYATSIDDAKSTLPATGAAVISVGGTAANTRGIMVITYIPA